MSNRETQATITAWQDATFGPTTPWLAWLRVAKEIEELEEYLCVPGKESKSIEECADVLITLYRVAQELGADLHAEVDRKMAINRDRTWVVDEKGHGQHV